MLSTAVLNQTEQDKPVSGDAIATLDTERLELRITVQIICSEELSREAIGWTADCLPWLEDEPSAVEAAQFVRKNYEGGLAAFYMASRVLVPTLDYTYLGK